jgi:hypothetical protein
MRQTYSHKTKDLLISIGNLLYSLNIVVVYLTWTGYPGATSVRLEVTKL